jgi:hypothetical protein
MADERLHVAILWAAIFSKSFRKSCFFRQTIISFSASEVWFICVEALPILSTDSG